MMLYNININVYTPKHFHVFRPAPPDPAPRSWRRSRPSRPSGRTTSAAPASHLPARAAALRPDRNSRSQTSALFFMVMGQNPGTPGEHQTQVIAGIYGCEYPTENVSIGIDPYPYGEIW